MSQYVKVTYTNEEGKIHTCRPPFVTTQENLAAHEKIHGAYILKVEPCDVNGVVTKTEKKITHFGGERKPLSSLDSLAPKDRLLELAEKTHSILLEMHKASQFQSLPIENIKNSLNNDWLITDEGLIKELSRRGKNSLSISKFLGMTKEDVEKVLSL